ncbi:MAG: FHA domain-containing protein [Acidobacteria bacterium]|nr:FHA domain-containing protein [Acidobacteriota bacterium]
MSRGLAGATMKKNGAAMAESRIQDERLAGDEIIYELLRNVDSGIFRIRHTALLPCVFNVHLHRDDYEQIRPILSIVTSEAGKALAERLEQLNAQSERPGIVKALGLSTGPRLEYKILEPDWSIDFHPDYEGRLQRGEIEIYSELGSEPRAELGAGAMTTLITRRAPDGAASSRQEIHEPQQTAKPVYGWLRYEDEGGPKTFTISKDLIVIGRGGKSFWVDVQTEAPADVSREHCRIRRDPAGRRFLIKDVSQFGTTVNGDALPSSIERTAGGHKKDINVETPLPSRARIGLAGVVFIDFEAA